MYGWYGPLLVWTCCFYCPGCLQARAARPLPPLPQFLTGCVNDGEVGAVLVLDAYDDLPRPELLLGLQTVVLALDVVLMVERGEGGAIQHALCWRENGES